MIRRLTRLAAAVVVTAAVGLVVPVTVATPAHAAPCAPGSDVTVVVDPGSLSGSTRVHCVGQGASLTANRLFESAGEDLTRVGDFPGMVCRVSGVPADVACKQAPRANYYWGLWWSDGESGKWTYSSRGVDSLKVPEGGTVAFAFQDSGTRRQPGVAPVKVERPQPTPAPSAKPSKPAKPKPSKTAKPGKPKKSSPPSQAAPAPGGEPSSPAVTPGQTPGESESPSESPSESAGDVASEDPAMTPPDPTNSTDPTDPATTAPESPATTAETPVIDDETDATSAGSDDSGGVPTWLVLGLIGLVGIGAATAAVVRRRSTGTP